MNNNKPIGHEDAMRALIANTDDRMAWIDRLDRYIKGTQYEDRPGWFTDEKPLLERAPCIVYPVAENANASNASMLLGEGRFPRIEVAKPTAPKGAEGVESPEDHRIEDLNAFINGGLATHARLKATARRIYRRAVDTCVGVAIICARGGRIRIDSVGAKVCTPTFVEGGRQFEVETLNIQYPYIDRYWHETMRKWAVRPLLFRRLITAESDVTFKPLPADIDGQPPKSGEWVRDDSKSVDHNLGFCPVIWYPHDHTGDISDGADGVAAHAHLLDEIDALNISLSQRQRAAIYCGDPQIVETGVSDDDVVLDGATPVILVDQAASESGQPSVYVQRAAQGGGQQARRKGAGTTWRYSSKDSGATILTLPGDALTAISENAKDIKAKLDESMCVVFIDPQGSGVRLGDLSGNAIRQLYVRQTMHCDDEREDFGDHGLIPLVDMLLRFVATVAGKGSGLHIIGLDAAAPALAPYLTSEGGKVGWTSPELTLTWGEYFTDNALDELNRIRVAAEASAAKLIRKRDAVAKVAPIFGIKDIDEAVEEIEDEADEHGSLEAAVKAMGAESAVTEPQAKVDDVAG